MSYYFCTAPKNIVLMEMDGMTLNRFVETGTYTGVTAEWASRFFKEVYTVESFEEYYRAAELRLASIPNVKLYLDDSRNFLCKYTESKKVNQTLFYLDAHWNDGYQYGKPLSLSTALDEIMILNQVNYGNRHAIIVDDAHRFGTEGWPTKSAIVEALDNNGQRKVRELLDVFIATTWREKHACLNAASANLLSFGREWN